MDLTLVELIVLGALIVSIVIYFLIDFIRFSIKSNKDEKEITRLDEVYNAVKEIVSNYEDYFHEDYGKYYFGWDGIDDLKSLKEETKDIYHCEIQVFMDIRRIDLITSKDKEKFYLVMYRYKETFAIILEKFKAAEKLSLLDDPDIHRIIQDLLSEPLADIEKIQSVGLAKIKQGLKDEDRILKGIREQKNG